MSFPVALRTIYADGGIPRFYRGVVPALLQGPLSRFGDLPEVGYLVSFLASDRAAYITGEVIRVDGGIGI